MQESRSNLRITCFPLHVKHGPWRFTVLFCWGCELVLKGSVSGNSNLPYIHMGTIRTHGDFPLNDQHGMTDVFRHCSFHAQQELHTIHDNGVKIKQRQTKTIINDINRQLLAYGETRLIFAIR